MNSRSAIVQATSCGGSREEGYGYTCRVCGDETGYSLCAFCNGWASRYGARLRDRAFWSLVDVIIDWDHVPDVDLWGCKEHRQTEIRREILARREARA